MAKRNTQDDLLGGFDEPEFEALVPTAAPEDETSGTADDDMFGAPAAAAAPPRENYVVLARKYRPQTFDQIVGQEHVQQALRGAIATGQISHAFLFSGPRGTGKTSTARILAKALNCQNGGPRPDPCGTCASCRSIANGSSLDVIEIDAASNTGVDNIRDLRSGVVLAPFSRYKVYIVDEVHMLSMQAFNALLKTLEEPPPQVVFVLATTEYQKVPETIVSRCQTFIFRRFKVSEIANQLSRILDIELKKRGLEMEEADRPRILDLLARNAEGGMRDAQVALDQVLVLSRGKLDFESVRRFLGIVNVDMLDEFVRAIYERRTGDLLALVDDLVCRGQDLERFTKSFAEYLRDLLILKNAPGRPALVNASEDRLALLTSLAESLPTSFLLNTSSTFLKLLEDMKVSVQMRFVLEIALIRLTRIDAVEDISKIVARLQEIERALAGKGGSGGGPSGGESVPVQPPRRPEAAPAPERRPMPDPNARREMDAPAPVVSAAPSPVAAPAQAPAVAVAPVAVAVVAESVAPPVAVAPEAPAAEMVMESAAVAVAVAPPPPAELLDSIRTRTLQRSHYLHMALLETELIGETGGTITLGVVPEDSFTFDYLNRPQSQQIIKEVLRECVGRDMQVRIERRARAEVVSPAPAPVPLPIPSASAEDAPDGGGEVAEPAPADLARLQEMAEREMVAEEPAEEPEPAIYYPPELIERTTRKITGENMLKALEKHADLKEVFLKVKEVFKVEDSQIMLRVRTL